MRRKISNRNAEIIKVMLSKKYRSISIIDIMRDKHNLIITASDINNIKKGMSYYDIRPDLNTIISNNFDCRNVDVNKINEVKWALANGFSETEITTTYEISRKKLMMIKMGYAPFCLIATEYNEEIDLRYSRRKKVNVDKKIVMSIKKEYIFKNGDITCAELASKYNIDKGTVSNILTLKLYPDYGKSYNLQILRIKAKANKLKNAKIELEKNRKIEAEKQKIQLYISQFNALNAKIDKSRKLVQSLKTE